MAIFKKARKMKISNEETDLIPEKIEFEERDLLSSILRTILEIGDEDDYEYLCKLSAKNFYNENKKFLKNVIVNNGDDLESVFIYLNYFLHTYSLGTFQAAINEDDKEIIIYHENSPFKKIYKKDYFLTEFYTMFFEELLELEVKITEGEEDEKTVFVITL
ncbi:hypothetical protein [Nautilia sp.]